MNGDLIVEEPSFEMRVGHGERGGYRWILSTVFSAGVLEFSQVGLSDIVLIGAGDETVDVGFSCKLLCKENLFAMAMYAVSGPFAECRLKPGRRK